MKKLVVLSFFAFGSIYFVACNRDSIGPDSLSIDAVSAATTGDSTKHHLHGDSLHTHGDSLRHKGKNHKDSLGVRPLKDSLGTKSDSLRTKHKKGPKRG